MTEKEYINTTNGMPESEQTHAHYNDPDTEQAYANHNRPDTEQAHANHVRNIKDIRDKGGIIHERLIHTPEQTTYTEEQSATQAFIPEHERLHLRIRRIKRFIYFIASTIVIFIFIRLLLQLFNANPDNAFFIFISIITAPFLAPFMNLFGPSAYAISLPALLFAIPIYYLFAWIAASLVSFIMRRSTPETV